MKVSLNSKEKIKNYKLPKWLNKFVIHKICTYVLMYVTICSHSFCIVLKKTTTKACSQLSTMTLDLTIIAAKVLELTPTQYFKNIKLNATTITKKKKRKVTKNESRVSHKSTGDSISQRRPHNFHLASEQKQTFTGAQLESTYINAYICLCTCMCLQ